MTVWGGGRVVREAKKVENEIGRGGSGDFNQLKLMKRLLLFPRWHVSAPFPGRGLSWCGGEGQTELHLKGKGRRKFFHLP